MVYKQARQDSETLPSPDFAAANLKPAYDGIPFDFRV